MKAKQVVASAAMVLSLALALSPRGDLVSAQSSVSGDETPQSEGSASDGQETPEELATVRMAIMTGGVSHWIAVIGDEAGIFARNGIQLEMTEFAAGVNTVDAVVMDQADIGYMTDYAYINRIGATQDSTDLVAIERVNTNEGNEGAGEKGGGLYVNPEKIQKLEDLAGEGFATLPGTIWDYWMVKTYEYAGIPESDRKPLNCDSATSAIAIMISGEAAAFWASGQNAARLEERGFKTILGWDDLGLYSDAYFITTKKFLAENPGVAEKFILAQKETADWIYENDDQAAAIFEEATGMDQEQFHDGLEGSKLVADFTQSALEHLNGVKDWAVANGYFEDYQVMDFVDLTALKAVFPDSVTVNE